MTTVMRQSTYDPGVGAARLAEEARLEAQADLTFETELQMMLTRGLSATGTVLDLGCGTGAVTQRLRQRMPKADVIAADVDVSLLTEVPGPRLLIEDGRVPLPDESVDDVVLRFVAQHLSRESRTELWAEVLRLLRPGGRLHVIDVDDLDAGSSKPAFAELTSVYVKLHQDQNARGGDRRIVRRLPDELTRAGFGAAMRASSEVTSHERPIADFGVHLGPERMYPLVTSGVLTLADLARVTTAWGRLIRHPDAEVSIKVHIVHTIKMSRGDLPGAARSMPHNNQNGVTT